MNILEINPSKINHKFFFNNKYNTQYQTSVTSINANNNNNKNNNNANNNNNNNN